MNPLILSAQQGDESALEQLVIKNSGLVYAVIQRFINQQYSKEELYQIGCLGLVKAIRRFDVSLEVQFSTYAVPLIVGEIKQFFRDNSMIKVSRSWKMTAYKAMTIQQEWKTKTGDELSLFQLAQKMNVDPEELVLAMEACKYPKSLEHTSHISDSDSPFYNLVDRIAVKEAIGKLEKEEQRLIVLRYFMEKSQKETGLALGLSQAHISRLEKKILRKLKEFL